MLAHPKRWIVAIISVFATLILAACDSSGPITGPAIPVEQKPAPDNGTPIKLLGTAGTLPVSAVAWSLDGKIMALGDSHGISLLDAHTLQDIRRIETQSWMKSLAFSPDGKWLAAGPAGDVGDTYTISPKGSISMWEVATGQLMRAWDSKDTGLVAGFQSNGDTLATLGNGVVRLWNVNNGQLVRDFRQPMSSWFIVSPDFKHVFQGEAGVATALWNLETNTSVSVPLGNNIRMNGAAFSPDGRRFVMAVSAEISLSDTIRIWNMASGQIEHTLGGPWDSHSLAFSPDGKLLAVGGSNDVVQLWDMEIGQLRYTLPGQKYNYQFAFSPDGTHLAVADAERHLRWWDTRTGQLVQNVEALIVDRIGYSPDGRLVIDQNDTTLRLWNAVSGQLVRTFDNQPLTDLAFTGDDRLIVIKPAETTLWQWDQTAQQLKLQNTLSGSGPAPLNETPHPAAVSPDGRLLAVLVATTTIQLLDTQSGQLVQTLAGHQQPPYNLMFTPAGDQLISISELPRRSASPTRNSDLRVWDVRSGQLLSSHETAPWLINVAGLPSAQTLLTERRQPDTCARHGSHEVALYTMADLLSDQAEISPRWTNALHLFEQVTLSADGAVSAVTAQSQFCVEPSSVQVWNTQTGVLLANVSLNTPTGKPVYATRLALNPNGSILAIGADDGSLTVWDVDSGRRLQTLLGLTASSSRLIFSPDGQLLISGNKDGQVQVWEARSGQLRQTLSGHTAEITHLQSGHQGRFLISGSRDGTARLWDLGADHLPAPAPAPFTSTYHSISLEPIANADTIFLNEIHEPLQTGRVELKGVPFEMARRIFKTQAAPVSDKDYPVIGTLTVNIPAATRLYVLLNSGNGFVKFKDKTIGQIAVTCDAQRLVVSDLQLGQNIREWVNTTGVISSAVNTLEVWTYPTVPSPDTYGHADLIGFALPLSCQQGTLTQVELIDTSRDSVGSLDPALNVFGVTIESRTR